MLETALGPLEEGDAGLEGADRARAPMMTEFGDYQLVEEIGRGGQGVVYRARQKSLNRTVALKVIGLGHWASTPHLKRFRHEAEAAASLEHPQIVPIYEIGERDGSCYFSMKFVEGGRLDEVVRQEPSSPRRAAQLLGKIARTVQFAHEHGILHRDIKPGNILLDRHGEPHLTDFGLARLVEQESTVTNSFDVLGTPSYMAPEQAAGHAKELTAAADVYSLGAVFYHMLAGEPPFAGGTTYETIRLVIETEPRNPRQRNPKVDLDLATICLKCLEKDPARRYQTAGTLADDVERWLKHEPILARRTGSFARGRKWIRRNPTTTVLAGSLAALFIMTVVIVWKSDLFRVASIKGIAVLPFENLSNDSTNTSFADGIQDDILTKLAKIAALKVISRTSVMQYRGARNIPEIGKMLGVSYVLQGSVRRSASRIHLNTQLIDTRTNSHVWAEEYDRDLIDTFSIQSEVAQKVAERLHAPITAAEEQSIARPPTADLTAFELYTRGKNLFLRVSYSNTTKEDLLEAANLLNQAVTRDPSFFQAYCQLVWVNDFLYIVGHDHTPARLALAQTALESALSLQPDAGEAHLTRAENLYNAHLDYDGALAELELARQRLPNEPRVFELRGYIERRQGKHEECLRSLQRANELDPRNLFTLQQIANSCILLQRFAEAKSALNRALAFEPDDPDTKGAIAWIDLEWKADIRPLHQTLNAMRAAHSVPLSRIADGLLICGLIERDAGAAKEALVASEQNTPLNDQAVHFGRSFLEGVIARMTHDENKAFTAFTAAHAEQEQVVQAQPNYAPALAVLGLIDAALGRKEEALSEGRRAVQLVPVEKDALTGPLMEKYLAMIAGWAGDKDLACEELGAAIRDHGTINYGYLRLFPLWDPLRGDPRFEKIVASLAPKA
jgi:serine/threonine protein kinase/tetratricopeptide (TPR) repeat protein